MHRFFVEKTAIKGNEAYIEGEDSKHIQRVLRLCEGDIIEICDGTGIDYKAQIVSGDKKRVNLQIIDRVTSFTEPNIKVTLYQCLPKASKMELIIQKCVELGIFDIVPVLSERTIVKVDGTKDIENKLARWNRISMEAAKQSRRGIIPKVSEPISFKEAVDMADASLKLLLWEEEKDTSLRSVLINKDKRLCPSTAVLIGPEGGLTRSEAEYASERGWQRVSIGPRILRTETAGICVLSIIMYQMEEMEWQEQP